MVVSTAVGKPEENFIEFEFKVFGVGIDHYKGLYYLDGNEYIPLNFSKAQRSRNTYHYKGPEVFSVFVKNPGYLPTNPDSPEYISITNAPINQTSGNLLIVFAARPKDRSIADTKRQFQLYSLNDTQSYFSRNRIVVLNTTSLKLYGRIGDQKVILPTGATEPIPYDSSKETVLTFVIKSNKGPRLVMSNKIKLSENRRVLLVLEAPRRPGSMRLSARMLSESIFPEEETR